MSLLLQPAGPGGRRAGQDQAGRVRRAEQRARGLAVGLRPARAAHGTPATCLPGRAAVHRPGVQRPVRGQQVPAASRSARSTPRRRARPAPGSVAQPRGRRAHRGPVVCPGGGGVQREAGALGGEVRPGARARWRTRANARSPTVSRSVTRSPSVSTWRPGLPAVVGREQLRPERPAVVARLRNLIWLTPVAPSAGPASGAGTPGQVCPASSVRPPRCSTGWRSAQACPPGRSPSRCAVPTKVTEVG